MGRNHVRVLAEMPDVALVAVADPGERALLAAVRGRTVAPYRDVETMLSTERPDFVVVATPTGTHAEVASLALRRGAHCLVEKPIAATIEDAEALVEVARSTGRLLAVGHVERYNPAVVELKKQLAGGRGGRVLLMTARRTGPFPDRIRDVGVITDLATHDVDVMLWLTGSTVERVFAECARRVHETHEDLLTGVLRFTTGEIGVLDVNWLTPFKTRELRVTCERGTYVANYLTQDLTFHENSHVSAAAWTTLSTLAGVAEGNMVRYAMQRVEPLRAELDAFVAAVQGDRTAAVVTPDSALDTLRVTDALLHAADRSETVSVAAGAR